MNEMQIFSNPAFGQVRVSIDASNQPIFCLADICGVLGVSNVGNVKSRLDVDDIRQADSIDSIGRTQKILYVTEEGFYDVVIRSDSPKAKPFRKWVTHEVLPSIRKHGVYMSDSILDQVIQHPEVIYTLAQELVAEREQLEGIRKQLDAAQPKADYFDTFVNSEDCTCIRNFCKEIGIPEKTAVALLLDHRYLYRSPSGWLMPFADKSARGYFIVRDCYGRSGKLVQQTRVTCKGKNHIFKLFKKWGVIE